eukprot:CAMPEP_0176310762 /NCGR_PEP_ID=MMETSP0121_2-20121125/65774_1 /TAXON_ID=160619 /ORGANISM="Kryptoperidinium foliaceum, Strain CCMP 1326" /LENGTH=73 /DNA_ID=CAMNT_0017652731 /DNA_START=12 /DNA_END=229 /DNA_ORIENTATION=-
MAAGLGGGRSCCTTARGMSWICAALAATVLGHLVELGSASSLRATRGGTAARAGCPPGQPCNCNCGCNGAQAG